MNGKTMRRKKSTLSEVKIAVIGAPGVGKTALSVRFLTKRYIGEYDHQSEIIEVTGLRSGLIKYSFNNEGFATLLVAYLNNNSFTNISCISIALKNITTDTKYKHEVLVDNDPVLYEILDTCPKDENDQPSTETLNWADGLLLVYSITDRRSFGYAKRVCSITPLDIPIYVVGNKNDMVHLRDVSVEEGAILARNLECGFSEVAAAEQVAPVAVVFQQICRTVLAARRKSKHSLLGRMLGNRSSNLRLYARGKSDSALPED